MYVGKADGRFFGEVKRSVDIAHEFPAGDRLVRRVLAGRGRVDDLQLVQLGQIGFCPVVFDIGRSKRGRQHAQQHGGRQHCGYQSFHSDHLFGIVIPILPLKEMFVYCYFLKTRPNPKQCKNHT